MTKSLEEIKIIDEALQEDAHHERRARQRAEKRAGEAVKKAADAERSEKACSLSYDSLQKDYANVYASLELRKKEAKNFAKEKLDLNTQHTKAQKLLSDELSTKQAEILELKRQLLEAKSSAPTGEQMMAQVEEVVRKLTAEFEAQKPLPRVQGTRDWRNNPDYDRAMEHDISYVYALGWSGLRIKIHEKQLLNLNDYRINRMERMTVDGYTLFRKKRFPYPINLLDTPEELCER